MVALAAAPAMPTTTAAAMTATPVAPTTVAPTTAMPTAAAEMRRGNMRHRHSRCAEVGTGEMRHPRRGVMRAGDMRHPWCAKTRRGHVAELPRRSEMLRRGEARRPSLHMADIPPRQHHRSRRVRSGAPAGSDDDHRSAMPCRGVEQWRLRRDGGMLRRGRGNR